LNETLKNASNLNDLGRTVKFPRGQERKRAHGELTKKEGGTGLWKGRGLVFARMRTRASPELSRFDKKSFLKINGEALGKGRTHPCILVFDHAACEVGFQSPQLEGQEDGGQQKITQN